ncbi:MAG TPA: FAD-dependent oxidoreductase, partial [bacterium]|nr:FAD-dependent oxidoreductase [bacterium]
MFSLGSSREVFRQVVRKSHCGKANRWPPVPGIIDGLPTRIYNSFKDLNNQRTRTMRNIGVIGAGHVGLVTAACFARLGHRVVCADNDVEKVERLKRLDMPFYEPGLEEIVRETVTGQRLTFTHSIGELAEAAQAIFIAVGTPATAEGRADLSYVEQVTVDPARALSEMSGQGKSRVYRLIVEKSTVPVLTGEWVKRTLELLTPTGVEFDVAANPEFLREGCAIKDFMEPDRIVVGVENERSRKIFQEI